MSIANYLDVETIRKLDAEHPNAVTEILHTINAREDDEGLALLAQAGIFTYGVRSVQERLQAILCRDDMLLLPRQEARHWFSQAIAIDQVTVAELLVERLMHGSASQMANRANLVGCILEAGLDPFCEPDFGCSFRISGTHHPNGYVHSACTLALLMHSLTPLALETLVASGALRPKASDLDRTVGAFSYESPHDDPDRLTSTGSRLISLAETIVALKADSSDADCVARIATLYAKDDPASAAQYLTGALIWKHLHRQHQYLDDEDPTLVALSARGLVQFDRLPATATFQSSATLTINHLLGSAARAITHGPVHGREEGHAALDRLARAGIDLALPASRHGSLIEMLAMHGKADDVRHAMSLSPRLREPELLEHALQKALSHGNTDTATVLATHRAALQAKSLLGKSQAVLTP